ncbi:hypothetical protein [Rhodohalobacter sp.]|uniref:hypothetical protein n=1 Tax=Rhodohalobacter sp. TaxID=1974210 RepID=UPI00356A47EA
MKKAAIFTLLLSLPIILVQCNQSENGERQQHMMSDGQMSEMMQNPEQRQALMTQMAQNPEMRSEFMSQMNSSMMNEDHEMMLDRMETMMNNPEQREQIRDHMQRMMDVLDSDTFDRDQMREMMNDSPMMGMHMNCVQMITDE